jgi:hypothetical protein
MDANLLLMQVEMLEGYRAIAERLLRRIGAGGEGLEPELVTTVDRMLELTAELRTRLEGEIRLE